MSYNRVNGVCLSPQSLVSALCNISEKLESQRYILYGICIHDNDCPLLYKQSTAGLGADQGHVQQTQ